MQHGATGAGAAHQLRVLGLVPLQVRRDVVAQRLPPDVDVQRGVVRREERADDLPLRTGAPAGASGRVGGFRVGYEG